MDIILRNAILSDADRTAAIASSLSAEHIAPSLADGGFDVLLASMDSEQTRGRIKDGWLHLCAIHENSMIGVVVVKPPSHLYHLFVLTEYQRKGVGTKLFSAADAATLATTDACLSTVNSSLNAIPAYQRLGFTVDGAIVETNGVRCQPMVRVIDR